jgi:hypothetical protein
MTTKFKSGELSLTPETGANSATPATPANPAPAPAATAGGDFHGEWFRQQNERRAALSIGGKVPQSTVDAGKRAIARAKADAAKANKGNR